MLFIYPPVAKPCEPPAGLARISGALTHHRISHRIVDANLEAFVHRLSGETDRVDSWTRRAVRHLPSNLEAIYNGQAFQNLDRYKRTVNDINRVVQMARPEFDGQVTLSNYSDQRFSPVRSGDLLRAAENPDQNPFFDYFSTRLDGLLEKDPPSRVGFSLNYLSQGVGTFAMAGYLRKRAPEIRIILGGGLVTSWLASPDWTNPFEGLIDEWVAGPGEGPLLQSRGIEPKKSPYRPEYEAFSLNRYLSPGLILPYSASVGCYWSRCSFCPECAEGNRFRPVPHPQVQSDLEYLIEKTGPVLVHLLDNALSPALLRHLSQNPIPASWYGFTRVLNEFKDLDYCRALRRSGCVMLKLGLESGDQTVLDHLDKGVDLETASAALINLKRAGIATYVYLLFGTPAEDLTRARRTLDFIARHGEAVDFLNLAIFNLPRYGPDTGELETDDFYEGDLSLYRQFHHPQGWHRPLVRQFLDREFKRHPAITTILRRDPPIFTSNHAALFKVIKR